MCSAETAALFMSLSSLIIVLIFQLHYGGVQMGPFKPSALWVHTTEKHNLLQFFTCYFGYEKYFYFHILCH